MLCSTWLRIVRKVRAVRFPPTLSIADLEINKHSTCQGHAVLNLATHCPKGALRTVCFPPTLYIADQEIGKHARCRGHALLNLATHCPKGAYNMFPSYPHSTEAGVSGPKFSRL